MQKKGYLVSESEKWTSFDERARSWDDDPKKVKRAAEAAASIREFVTFHPGLSVLDYGAGTGLLCQQFASEVGPITYVDVSKGMREVMAEKAALGILGDATITEFDLSKGEIPEKRFGLITSLLALHHTLDIPALLQAFRVILEPDGEVCIVDLDKEDGSFHKPGFVGHDGFERDHLEELFRAAGFGQVTFDDSFELTKNGRTYATFVVHAKR